MSTEELYHKVRAKHPNIGYTTVYRTLRLFVESGIAREIRFSDGHARFEIVQQGEQHDHLICTCCNSITEFKHEAFEKLQGEIANMLGFYAERHRLEVYGLCTTCRA